MTGSCVAPGEEHHLPRARTIRQAAFCGRKAVTPIAPVSAATRTRRFCIIPWALAVTIACPAETCDGTKRAFFACSTFFQLSCGENSTSTASWPSRSCTFHGVTERDHSLQEQARAPRGAQGQLPPRARRPQTQQRNHPAPLASARPRCELRGDATHTAHPRDDAGASRARPPLRNRRGTTRAQRKLARVATASGRPGATFATLGATQRGGRERRRRRRRRLRPMRSRRRRARPPRRRWPPMRRLRPPQRPPRSRLRPPQNQLPRRMLRPHPLRPPRPATRRASSRRVL